MSKARAKQKPKTWLVLLALVVVAGALTAMNLFRTQREIKLATGPPTPEQERYYVEVLERPDLMPFFKSLSKTQKLTWSRNLGEHDDPAMVRLAMRFLEDFDEDVRNLVTDSLIELVKKQPEAVSKELKPASTFQQLAVFKALKQLGNEALPHVAARLRESETRANAAGFLVEAGAPAVPYLQEALEDESPDVRLAAADALGKLRVSTAVPRLTNLYDKAEGPEKLGYLSALAAIGSPESEQTLAAALDDEKLLSPTRVDVALGLGRTATASAAAKLWSYVDHQDRELARGAISALQLAGDAALADVTQSLQHRLSVASGIRTPTADALIRTALRSPDRDIRLRAAEMAAGRSSLVPAVSDALHAANGATEGDLIDMLVRTLMSTEEGRRAADKVPPNSIQGAFVKRARL